MRTKFLSLQITAHKAGKDIKTTITTFCNYYERHTSRHYLTITSILRSASRPLTPTERPFKRHSCSRSSTLTLSYTQISSKVQDIYILNNSFPLLRHLTVAFYMRQLSARWARSCQWVTNTQTAEVNNAATGVETGCAISLRGSIILRCDFTTQ